MTAPGKNIVWIASYPKSGNTWLRIFLGNYLLDPKAPMPINEAIRVSMADSSASDYRKAARGPFNSAEPMQALRLRHTVLAEITRNGADVNLVKSHNLRSFVFGVELVPGRLTRSAIYIIRDPRDVAVSYARHYGRTPDQAIEALGSTSNSTAGRGDMVKQFLGSWSQHVTSWTNNAYYDKVKPFPVLTLRYEDMRADPQAAFTQVLDHLGVPVEKDRLDRAIRFSDFGELRRQEDATPFVDRPSNTERFFHTGTSGQWMAALNGQQSARIEADHGAVMRRFGYLAA